MKHIMYVNFKEDDAGNRFYFVDLGSETHGAKSFRLWISSKLVRMDSDGNEYIEFPAYAYIKKTERGTLILKPSDEYIVHYIYVSSGYRGSAQIEILEPKDHTAYKFYVYHSPRGRLGVDEGALVVVPKDTILKYRWTRSGRLYGSSPHGITIVMPDGEEKEFDMLADGIEELETLKRELQ